MPAMFMGKWLGDMTKEELIAAVLILGRKNEEFCKQAIKDSQVWAEICTARRVKKLSVKPS